jgi:hypothetical protein
MSVNLPVNHNIFFTRQLNPINYGKKSTNDSIGPSLYSIFLSHGNMQDFNLSHFTINLLALARILHINLSSHFNFQQQQDVQYPQTMDIADMAIQLGGARQGQSFVLKI